MSRPRLTPRRPGAPGRAATTVAAQRRRQVVEVDRDPHPAGLQRRPAAVPVERGDAAFPATGPARAPDRRPATCRGSSGGAVAPRGSRPGADRRWPSCGPRRIEGHRRDRLALQGLAGRGELRVQVGDDPFRLLARRADRLVALAARPTPLLLGRRAGPRARGPRPARARSSASLVSPSVALIAARVASNERWASVRRERASSTIALGQARAARRWRTPGCRRAGRS